MVHYVFDIQAFKKYLNNVVVKAIAIVVLEPTLNPRCFCSNLHFCGKVSQRVRKLQQVVKLRLPRIILGQWRIPHEVLEKALVNCHTIFVKGLEKKKWVKELLPSKFIYNVEGFWCPALQKLPPVENLSYSIHAVEESVCTAQNVYKLRDWLLSQKWTKLFKIIYTFENNYCFTYPETVFFNSKCYQLYFLNLHFYLSQ